MAQLGTGADGRDIKEVICNKLKTMQISVHVCPIYINKNYLCVSESRKTKEMEQIDNLKELINQGDVDTAIKQLDQHIFYLFEVRPLLIVEVLLCSGGCCG